MDNKHLLNTYRRLPVEFTHGKGCWLWDTEGNKVFDALSGIAVTGLGHAHPGVVDAITKQAQKLMHTSNLVQISAQAQLADKLCELSGLDQVFVCNSGAEAVEGLLKLARLYARERDIASPKIIVAERAFHGRTMGTISAGGNPNYYNGFEPLLPGFVRVPFNDMETLQNFADNDPDICAVLLEPIQGEGGIRVPDEDYLIQVRKLCNKQNWLLLLDEVQAGMGRTGKWFSYMHQDIKPDAISLAKGLANGMPIGAFVVRKPYCDLFKPGSHGTTFGGNPVACQAALATCEAIEQAALFENAHEQGQIILETLKDKLHSIEEVVEVRGKGLMIGIELNKPCRDILPIALKNGLLFNVAQETVIRLLPPLIMNNEEREYLIEKLVLTIEEYLNI